MSIKVLLVQEFGSGSGHVSALLRIAARLTPWQLAFAVPAPSLDRQSILAQAGNAAEINLAPALTRSRETLAMDWTLADVLGRLGYASPAKLRARAAHWQAIVARTSPDLVVADYAPTLRLILPKSLPLLVTGNWFTVPPAGQALPSFRPGNQNVPPASRQAERRALANANLVRGAHGLPPLPFLADIFQGDATLPVCFAAFDLNANLRPAPMLAPANVHQIPAGPAIAERTGPAIFAYLDAEMPHLNLVLTALNLLAVPTQIFVRGGETKVLAAQMRPHVRIHPVPARFAQVLPQARLFLHYGASGAGHMGLLAGVPQMLVASTAEHQGCAYGVQSLGCGLSVGVEPGADAKQMAGLMADLLNNHAMHQRCYDVAAIMATAQVPDTAIAIANAARALLSSRNED